MESRQVDVVEDEIKENGEGGVIRKEAGKWENHSSANSSKFINDAVWQETLSQVCDPYWECVH